jgi:hypothetical protein
MVIFTWKIPQLERLSSDGFVTSVHYTVEAKDNEFSTYVYGILTYEDQSKMVIDFDKLTEEEVIGWVQSSLNKDAIESSLMVEIENQKAPAKKFGLPWNGNKE